MQRKELIEKVAVSTGFAPMIIETTLDSIVETIKATTSEGGSVTIRKFGSFRPVHLSEKKGRDIHAGTEVMIPERTVIRFKQCKKSKATVK